MSDFADGVRAVAAVIIPRREPFETGSFYGWRNGMAAAVLFTGGAVMSHIALACGYITFLGFTGFAQAQDVGALRWQQQQLASQMQKSSNEIMQVVIGEQIFDLNYKRCTAIKARNESAIQAYSQELQGKVDYFQRITGHGYTLQGCP